MNVAILGATGAVGREMMKILAERSFPVEELRLLASPRSAGQKLLWQGRELTVQPAEDSAFEGMDVVLGAAENDIAKRFAPAIVKAGAVFVDNSSAFRMDPNVPLVIPEINPEDARRHKGIIANPNCTTIVSLVAINALNQDSPIQSIIASSYQAVAGAGAGGPRELMEEVELLRENGVEMISADLLAPGALDSLPDAENVIYMAGKKFGTDGNEYATWAMNTWLPSRVAERYQNSRIVVFSSGNLYPKVGVHSGGATEETRTEPVGEYCMSCQGRERMFEYAAKTYGTRVAVYRLNYAVDLRYGVLYDMAHNILEGKPISITTPSFNCIWQGDANEAALRLLGHASAEVFTLNVTGPETAGVQETAKKLGALLGREPIFTGEASDTAYLNNAGKMFRLFGYPTVPLETLIEWQAQWILDGGRALGKPTHFEERKGSY